MNVDPLLIAGVRRCRCCARANFPVDACWIDEQQLLLLVHYPRVCEHLAAAFVFADGRDPVASDRSGVQLRLPEPAAAEIAADIELQLPNRRCAARSRHRGRACKSAAAAGSAFCYWHQLDSSNSGEDSQVDGAA